MKDAVGTGVGGVNRYGHTLARVGGVDLSAHMVRKGMAVRVAQWE